MIVAAVLFASPALFAHHLSAPKVDLLAVSQKEIRIAVDYSVDPAKAADMRELFDRDRDGTLAGDERKTAEAWLRVSATHFLGIKVDGKSLALGEVAAEFRGLDAGGVPSAMFVLTGPVSLGKGAHRLELSDRHKDATIAVPVSVSFARGLTSELGEGTLSVGAQTPSLAIEFRAQ